MSYNHIWDKVSTFVDPNAPVKKFVFTKNNAVAETVLYHYRSYLERTVICCSTMSGCPIGCRFCGAGDFFVRNLTADEIVNQVDMSLLETGVNPLQIGILQVMFMSMGEPMLNLKQLIPAIRILNNKYPNARLLVSTSAPLVNFADFFSISREISQVGLQFSVHESTDERRNELIPFKKKMTLAQISSTGNEWFESTGRNPFFNYCAHPDNSSVDDADRLLSLFSPTIWKATVSVICEREDGFSHTNERQLKLATDFSSLLLERGFDVRVFNPSAQDTIGGGCGQLKYVQQWFKDNEQLAKPSIGFGKKVVHTPNGVV